MIMPLMVIMLMPIGFMVFIFYIVHPTYRAFTCLLTSTSFTMHWTDVSRGIFFALFFRICRITTT